MMSALALAVALAACGGGRVTTTETSTGSTASASSAEATEAQGSDAATELLGGWAVSTEATSTLAAEEQAIFDQAMGDLVGVEYTPVALLGTQVVAGTNYAYLCSGEVMDGQGTQGWYVVVIYEDLDGNAEVTSIESFDFTAYVG